MDQTKPSDADILAAVRHLDDTRDSLIATAPVLSAYLGSQKTNLKADSGITPEDEASRQCCHSCSNILIPGWSCKKLRIKDQPRRKKRAKKHIDGVAKASETKLSPAMVVYTCDLCRSNNKSKIPEKKGIETRSSRPYSRLPAIKSNSAMETTPSLIPSNKASTSSPPVPDSPLPKSEGDSATATGAKKRSRKNKTGGGLAALLAKSKSASASPAGFDLMDFMKSG